MPKIVINVKVYNEEVEEKGEKNLELINLVRYARSIWKFKEKDKIQKIC